VTTRVWARQDTARSTSKGTDNFARKKVQFFTDCASWRLCPSKGVFLSGFLSLAVSKSTGEFEAREDNGFPTLLHHCLAGRRAKSRPGRTMSVDWCDGQPLMFWGFHWSLTKNTLCLSSYCNTGTRWTSQIITDCSICRNTSTNCTARVTVVSVRVPPIVSIRSIKFFKKKQPKYNPWATLWPYVQIWIAELQTRRALHYNRTLILRT